MDKRFAVLVLMVGFLTLGASGEEANNDAGSYECPAMNGSSRLTGTPTRTKKNCQEETIKFWLVVPIPEDIRHLVAEARQYYDQPEAVGSDYKVPKMSDSCKELEQAAICRLKEVLPCWDDDRVIPTNKHKAFLDVVVTDTIQVEQVAYIKAIHEARYACKHGRFAGKAMRDDGVFMVFKNWRNEPEIPTDSREQCLEKAIKFFDGLPPLPAEIRTNVMEARRYYSDPEQTFGEYREPNDTPACKEFYRAIFVKSKRKIPCFHYDHIVGRPHEAWSSAFERSNGPKRILEALNVCEHGLYAGRELAKLGLLDRIIGWDVPNVSRDECIEEAINFWETKMPLPDDIQALIAEASKYYHLGERIPGYIMPLPSDNCFKFDHIMEVEFLKAVPCWEHEEIMGDDWDKNWLDGIKKSPVLRSVKEAEFACFSGNNAGFQFKDYGLLDGILGKEMD